MEARVAQWIGRRESQQDFYVVRSYPRGMLAIVCDGMGGHANGELCARVAAEAFGRSFEENERGSVAERFREALSAANEAVCGVVARTGQFGGCTLLAAFVAAGVLWWVSVGDSPLFLWRRNRLIRLNADHSMRAVFEEFVQSGIMSHTDALAKGHELRSALTGEPVPMVDLPLTPYLLLPGDRMIMASDGTDELLQVVPLPRATRALLDNRSGSLAAMIVQACEALDNPVADNTTVITVDV